MNFDETSASQMITAAFPAGIGAESGSDWSEEAAEPRFPDSEHPFVAVCGRESFLQLQLKVAAALEGHSEEEILAVVTAIIGEGTHAALEPDIAQSFTDEGCITADDWMAGGRTVRDALAIAAASLARVAAYLTV